MIFPHFVILVFASQKNLNVYFVTNFFFSHKKTLSNIIGLEIKKILEFLNQKLLVTKLWEIWWTFFIHQCFYILLHTSTFFDMILHNGFKYFYRSIHYYYYSFKEVHPLTFILFNFFYYFHAHICFDQF